MKDSASKVDFASFDDLFGKEGNAGQEQVLTVDLGALHTFNNHPFRVLNNEEMQELAESIKERGVLVPGLVRPRKAGGYELIAGHRRKYGSVLAGKKDMPVICRELSDDDATLIMVDSNIQRENLLPSEKAFAYRMKMEALRHQGKKGGSTAQEVGEKAGDDARKVQRYIRLTYLLQELLDAVDNKKIPVIAGSDISFLKAIEQEWLVDYIDELGKYPTGGIATELKKYSQNGELTRALVKVLLKGKELGCVKVSVNIREYFPAEYKKEDIEGVIYSLLEKWKAEQNNE